MRLLPVLLAAGASSRFAAECQSGGRRQRHGKVCQRKAGMFEHFIAPVSWPQERQIAWAAYLQPFENGAVELDIVVHHYGAILTLEPLAIQFVGAEFDYVATDKVMAAGVGGSGVDDAHLPVQLQSHLRQRLGIQTAAENRNRRFGAHGYGYPALLPVLPGFLTPNSGAAKVIGGERQRFGTG